MGGRPAGVLAAVLPSLLLLAARGGGPASPYATHAGWEKGKLLAFSACIRAQGVPGFPRSPARRWLRPQRHDPDRHELAAVPGGREGLPVAGDRQRVRAPPGPSSASMPARRSPNPCASTACRTCRFRTHRARWSFRPPAPTRASRNSRRPVAVRLSQSLTRVTRRTPGLPRQDRCRCPPRPGPRTRPRPAEPPVPDAIAGQDRNGKLECRGGDGTPPQVIPAVAGPTDC